MKFVVWVAFAGLVIALSSAAVIPQEDYLPPALEEEQVAVEQPVEETAALSDDGYRYKTIRKLRHRRDVSELLASGAESAVLADDGYHYKTPEPSAALETVSNEYLPPNEEASETNEVSEAPAVSNEYLPPVENDVEAKEAPVVTEAPVIVDEPVPAEEVLAPVSNEYLPPADDSEVIEGPAETAVLADDGYHYRRIRYRRDVSEIAAPASGYLYEAPVATEEVANVYLPPAEVKEAAPEPSEAPEEPEAPKEYLPPVEVKEAPEEVEAAPESVVLADDGYRYKTVRRIKYRHRRDVSEIAAPSSGYLYEAPVATEEVANVYLPPAEVKEAAPETSEEPEALKEYLPPVEVKEAPQEIEATPESVVLADDGYRYKTVRRIKYRHRRDVSEILAPAVNSAILAEDGYHYKSPEASEINPKVSNEYLPPVEDNLLLKEAPAESEVPEVPEVQSTEAPVSTEAAPVATEESATEAPTTVPALKVSNEYLPPSEDVPELKEASEPVEESAVLAEDGYHYKVGRRFRFRRDVSELPAVENAPNEGYSYPSPAKEAVEVPVEAPIEVPAEAPVEVPAEESAVLADDGYRYKTVRKIRYRHRRDVSELVAPAEESAVLAADGYHYKKPENELPVPSVANEYLPPVEPVAEVNEVPEDSEVIEAAVVPEVKEVSNEYLPPSEVKGVSNEYLPPAEAAPLDAEVVDAPVESAALADDGYRYKTVRRIRYRHRRDVSELVAPAEESAILAADGYHYKKPENELPAPSVANEYLPPVEPEAEVNEVPEDSEVIEAAAVPEVKEVSNEYLPPSEVKEFSNEYLPPVEAAPLDAEVVDAPLESAALADDGYRYKTVRRIRYRHRRDVSELVAPAEDSAVLAADGYHYKKPENELQVPSVSNEYLPPVEEAVEVNEVPEDSEVVEAEVAPEVKEVSNEYLPPAEAKEITNEYLPPAEVAPLNAESAALADDGYRYKTVRRIRYRHRRDVSEIVNAAANGYVYAAPAASEPEASEPVANEDAPIESVSNEYLPPVEKAAEVKEAAPEPTEASPEISNEYLPPAEETSGNAEIVEVPQETAVLADDGYRYKAVRRIRYRHRRDVSEIAAPVEPEPEYLPPAEEVAELKAAAESDGGASVLAEDGYRYKTVKRHRK